MSKNNNVIEEIQELIQYIKNYYQEGVDYKFVAPNLIKRASGGFHIQILSPNLKKDCRERFSLPLFDNGHVFDYEKGDNEGNDLYYRTGERSGYDSDILDCAGKELYRHNGNKQEPKTCKSCGKLTSYKKGQINEWSRKDMVGKLGKVIDNYFHPKCAKRYFANKKQPNENNTRIKEKLLRNLDKLCLDPDGYLANNEYLKTDQADKEYHQAFNSNMNNWVDRYLKIIIEGEEINLEKWDNSCEEYYEVKRKLIKKIKSEIKQNPSEWKIERAEILPGLTKYDREDWLVKHQSGRRYWKFGISNMRGKQEWRVEGKKDWPEIEALINGSKFPDKNNKPSNSELENLKKIFQEHNIKKITFENNQLTIKYDNKEKEVNNQEFQELEKYCQEHNEKEITKEKLNLGSNTDSSSTSSKPSQWENKYLWLAGGILVGVIISIILFARGCRKKIKK